MSAFMTGSGPTVFGIFTDEKVAKEAFSAVEKTGLAKQLFLSKPINPNR